MKSTTLFRISTALCVGCLLLVSCNHESDDERSVAKAEDAGSVSSGNGAGAGEVCGIMETDCGEGDDDEDCVDLNASTRHCGACGRRCFSHQECTDGECRGVGVLSPDELSRALEDQDFLLINVRAPAQALIPGTDASVPHNRLDLMKEVIGEDRERRVVLYCGTSTRIRVALRLLRDEGYENVSVLENGVAGWERAGYSTISGAAFR